MNVWIYTIISVILVSSVSLIGIFTLLLNKDIPKKTLLFLVSFAVGGLFGDAFIHLLPESFEKLGANLTTSLYIVLGILIFFALEKFIRWRHCHIASPEGHTHPVAVMNLIGDSIHNLIDGMLIGASYTVSNPIGISTTLAIILHEIPQEMGDFGVLLQSGFSVKKAVAFNFLSALTAILGAIISLFAGSHIEGYSSILLPITAGGFIYIAGSDLIPELQHECKLSPKFATCVYAIRIFICLYNLSIGRLIR
ncbi:MAG: ZIP family metal transporter [Candidatus Methanoperedens sp.]|nr:ZIP family metal transporter [Candidatus Methanoperedens sp.]